MLLWFKRFVLGLVVSGTAIVASRVEAAHDLAQPYKGRLEMVVLEINGCTYCPLLRKDLARGYATSPRAREMPVRFVDVEAIGVAQLNLRRPIVTVPTTVVMRDRAEIGRIEGYVAPEDFGRAVTRLLEQ